MKRMPLIGWFLVGLLWDGILTFDLLFTANELVLAAGFTTFTLNVLSFTVYSRIISRTDNRLSTILAISSGAAVGAMLSISIF